MHKKSIKALAMIVAICFIFVVIDICYNNTINTESVYLNELESTNQINFAQQDTINLSKTANISSGIDTNVIEDKKIIKTTHLSIQVYDFDNTIENLKQITHQHGGYIENSSSNIKYTDIENNSILKAGDIVLRVPAQNYTSVLNLVLKIGKVIGSYEQGEDVTTTYIDTEAVIDAKELEKERLMQLIEKADSINDLILLEDRLSQISSDIESYKSKIKNWDRLVQFSTITINIEQIQDKSKISTISPNLVDRIKDGFISSINNIKQQVENLIVLVAQFTPFLIILIIFLLLIKIICSCIRKSRKKKL